MSKINQKHLRNMPFPLAPLNEQEAIVDELNQVTSVVDGALQNVRTELERADNLRQSVLNSIFQGKLAVHGDNEERPKGNRTQKETAEKMKGQITLSEVVEDAQ